MRERKKPIRTSRGANDDVVDGDEDELDEEANEPHNHEPDGRTERHLGELYSNINTTNQIKC